MSNKPPEKYLRVYLYALDILKNSTPQEVADYSWRMNRWEWPFPLYEEYYKSLSTDFKADNGMYTMIRDLMEYCKLVVSKKESFKFNCVEKGNMSLEEFEIKWKDDYFSWLT